MDPEVVGLWHAYRKTVDRVYTQTEDRLVYRDEEVEEAAIEELVEASWALTKRLRADLGPAAERSVTSDDPLGEEVVELETAALAAATVDVAIAGDIAAALRETAEESGRNLFPVPAAIEQNAPAPEERDRLDRLLERAEGDFPEGMLALGGGGAAAAPFAERQARDAIDELVKEAARPATKFGTGLISVGVSDVIGALGAFEWIGKPIEGELSGRVKWGLGLVESAAGKLAALVGVEPLREIGVDLVLAGVERSLEARTNPVGETILRWTVRVGTCEELVQLRLIGGETDTGKLETELNRLRAAQPEHGLGKKVQHRARLVLGSDHRPDRWHRRAVDRRGEQRRPRRRALYPRRPSRHPAGARKGRRSAGDCLQLPTLTAMLRQ